MAYVLRYKMNFVDKASGYPVVINIYYPDFDGEVIELIPADSPCIVSELNSSENIFSSIRAKEYKIKFVTDNLVYPGIVDFATNNDNDWKVDILVNGATWLTGFILTDQISEGWYTDNTNHYIELTATDNLGTLKKIPLKDIDGTDFVPTTKQFLIDIVKAALNQANDRLPINIFDNLFEVNFSDRNDTVVNSYETTLTGTAPHSFIYLIQGVLVNVGDIITITGSVSNNGTFTVTDIDRTEYFAHFTVAETVVNEAGTASVNMDVSHVATDIDSYQQCMVDMRTFVTNYTIYDDAYTVLTKILESRNSVLFQHLGEWYIVRISELFLLDTINGTRYEIDDSMTAVTNASWKADLNQDGDIIPVEQFMIKSFLNPVLSNKVFYKYSNFDELFCNELWQRGPITTDTDTLKEYDVDCWNHYQGAIISTTPASVGWGRRQVIDAGTSAVVESYIFLEHETGSGGESFVRSSPSQISKEDKITISFSRRVKNGYTGSGTESLARVLLYAYDGTRYTLDDDGQWYLSNSTFTSFAKILIQSFSSGDNRNDWFEKTVEADFIPKSGELVILLYEGSATNFTGQETHFRDLKVTYQSYLDGRRFVGVDGDYNKLTLSTALKDTAEYEVFLSDSPKYLFKGALFLSDEITLTSLWYEMSDPAVEYPIKRFNAIDHYRVSHRNMLKSDGTFYNWIKDNPINSIQKITINNGDANKRFMPAYLRDLDISGSRFSSLLIEVFDESKDIEVTTGYHDVTTTETNTYTLDMILIAPDQFQFDYTPSPQPYFLADDEVTIDGVGTGTIATIAIIGGGDTYLVTMTGLTVTSGTLTSVNVTVVRSTTVSVAYTITTYPVNATHEFNYIFKSK